MDIDSIVKAWKNPEYRLNLSVTEMVKMPPHPSGAIELTDEDLRYVVSAGSNTGRPKKQKPSPTPQPPEPPTLPWRRRPRGRVASWKPGY